MDILSEDKNVLKSPPFKILFENFGGLSIGLTAFYEKGISFLCTQVQRTDG